MKMWKPPRSFSSRGTALVLALLSGFSLALFIAASRVVSAGIQDKALDALSSLATAKQGALEAQVSRYFSVLEGIVLPGWGEEVGWLMESEGPERERRVDGLERALSRRLYAFERTVCAQIRDLDQSLLLETNPEHCPHLERGPDFLRAARLGPAISDPYLDEGTFIIDLAVPLFDLNGDVLAILVLKKGVGDLLATTGEHGGLGSTGEVVLGKRYGDRIHFLLPLRFEPDLSKVEPAAVSGERAGPMILATAGLSGTQVGLQDYRGRPVAAAYRPIAGTSWGMVVKQDVDEIFAPVRSAQRNVLMVLLAGLGIAAAFVYPVLRALTQPLRTLRDATETIAEGSLEFRVPKTSDPEIDALGVSFNRMVERIASSQAELVHKNAELDEFAQVVSHDLKAPLRGLASLSQWLQDDLGNDLPDGSRSHLEQMREQVVRMDALINGLLDYSRIGRLKLDPVMVDVGALIPRVVADLSLSEGFEVLQTSPLPKLKADPIRLTQVFQNLVGNAVEHHPGPTGRIEISCRDAGSVWEFAIKDDGSGIESEYHDRIFMVFRSLGVESSPESTGIGLAVVKKIVEGEGGTVWVESDGKPGHGSVFRFTWPKAERNAV